MSREMPWAPLSGALWGLSDKHYLDEELSARLAVIAESVELREAEASSAYESVGLLMKALGHGGGHGAMTIEVIERMQKAEAALASRPDGHCKKCDYPNCFCERSTPQGGDDGSK